MKKINLLFLVSYIIFVISIIYTIIGIGSVYNTRSFNKSLNSASTSLNLLKRDCNEEFSIQKELNKFYIMLSENKCEAKDLEKKYQELNQSGYGFIKLRFFNKGNNCISLKTNDNNEFLNGSMQRLYTALASYRLKNDETLLKRYRSLFETVLGAVDLRQLAKETSTLIPANLGGKPGYIYWNLFENESELKDIGGMIAWLKESEIPLKLFHQKAIDKYNYEALSQETYQKFGLIDTNENGYIYTSNLAKSISDLNYNDLFIKIQEMKASFRNHEKISSYIFHFKEIDSGRYLFCLTSTYSNIVYYMITTLLVIIVTSASICFCRFHYNFIKQIEEQPEYQKTTKKILTTITISSISAIILLISVNYLLYQFKEHYQKEQIYSNLNSVVDWLDEGYNLTKKELSEKWLALSQKEEVINISANAINSLVSSLPKNSKIERMFITDKSGKILYSYPDDHSIIFSKLIPVIGRKIASEHLGTEENWKNKIENMMMNTISSSFTDLLGEGATSILNAFEKTNKVSEVELGSKRHLVFTTLITTQNRNPLVVIIMSDSNYFCRDYLVNKIKDLQALPEDLRDIILAIVPVHYDSQPYPPEITKYSFARDITERVAYTNQSIPFETIIGGQNSYGIGTKVKNFSDYVIFAIQGKN